MSAEELEAALLGAPTTLTSDEVAALAGVDLDDARAIWAALGFPHVQPEVAAFTRRDVEALQTAFALRDSGMVDPDTLLMLARSMGQGLARLAEGQVEVLRGRAEGLSVDEARAVAIDVAGEAIPGLEQLMVLVWRRQLAAATARSLAAIGGEHPVLAVGFVDIVGFTQTSRESDATALQRLLERFERETSLRVTAGGGRVIKMLGDEVLFVTEDVRAAAEVALETVAAHEQDESLPQVRAGVALGPVLVRLGDVFGEPVNLASRLTAQARAGTVLVDREAAAALRQDSTYALVPLEQRSVRGYRALRPHVLRRAT
ncbi:MAG: adenylate/guanylate cyclase domain-containing protein [Frankiaceae bacterium]|nr:adenylate/guanylate cyclase domain-containing protein [Frankiaceae bacterium]